MPKPVAFLVALVLYVALSIVGCGAPRTIDLTSCESPYPDPSCPKEETCPGQCVPIPPVSWTDPLLLWIGDELMAPECPADRAGKMVYEGHADPIDPPACPSCTCEPPEGECHLPSVLTASTGFCGEFGVLYDFSGLDPDPASCNVDHPIDVMMDLKSVRMPPLHVSESGCKSTVIPPPPRSGSTSWKTYARACRGVAFAPCRDSSSLCVPTAEPPPPGFSQCIFHDGDNECPSDYPDKHLFFDGASDTRSCSPCSCGEPIGSACSAIMSLYQGAMCTTLVAPWGVQSATPSCFDFLPVPALLGKKVEYLTYAPGECVPSGGELMGSFDLLKPSTFCCQENEAAPHP